MILFKSVYQIFIIPLIAGAARRKRSFSDADYSLMKSEKVESTKKAFKSKKMPDFAAIHSKQINKMESIADNLARKQERAIQLTTPNKAKHAMSDMERGESKITFVRINLQKLVCIFQIRFHLKSKSSIRALFVLKVCHQALLSSPKFLSH